MDKDREAKGETEACPLCREALGSGAGRRLLRTCPGCGTRFHRVCFEELRGCSTLGCPEADGGRKAEGSNPPGVYDTQEEIVLTWEDVGPSSLVLLALGLAFAGVAFWCYLQVGELDRKGQVQGWTPVLLPGGVGLLLIVGAINSLLQIGKSEEPAPSPPRRRRPGKGKPGN